MRITRILLTLIALSVAGSTVAATRSGGAVGGPAKKTGTIGGTMKPRHH